MALIVNGSFRLIQKTQTVATNRVIKMNNRRVAETVKLYSVMGVLLALPACSSQSISLIHPQSGATAECSARGFAIAASIADGVVGSCSRVYEDRG